MIASFNPTSRWHRIALADPKSRRILAERSERAWQLPRIVTPRWTRAAEHAQIAIKDHLGFRAVILDILEEVDNSSLILAEYCAKNPVCPKATRLQWIALNDLPLEEISEAERLRLDLVFRKDTAGRGRFARFGWVDEALEWLSQVTGTELEEFVEIRQLNVSAESALVCFRRRAAPPLWLKASAGPLTSEFQITMTLAGLFPDYLPRIVAARKDWQAWCMEDAGGPLERYLSKEFLGQAMEGLAEIQKASLPLIPALKSSGCRDRGTEVLLSRIPEIIDLITDAMAEQDAEIFRRFSARHGHELECVLKEACLKLQSLKIPDALLHCDISLDNILVGPRGSVFVDWANAGIGNPFITFEQLRVQIDQDPITRSWLPDLARAYERVWLDALGERQIRQTQILIPPIAAFTHLLHQLDCHVKQWRHPMTRAFLRGMARQIDQAAASLDSCGAKCA